MGLLDRPASQATLVLIEKFGQTVTLREVTTGAFQPATDTVGNTDVDHLVKAVVPQKVSRESRGLMKEGDQVHIVAAAALSGKEVTTDWLLKPPATQKLREIVGVNPVVVGDAVVMYEIISRGV